MWVFLPHEGTIARNTRKHKAQQAEGEAVPLERRKVVARRIDG